MADDARVCQHCAVRARHIALVLGAAAATSWSPLSAPVPSASAQPCPDVEVVFARGTTEDPGVGPTGQAFVDALRARMGAKSMGVYPVDYPATMDFPTAVDGIRDASAHVESTATNCPNTKMVLGGFSQGAAVMGFVTANIIPDGAPDGVPNPMPSDVANHVAAVALFGKPNTRFMRAINQPQIDVGPAYAAKTIDLCVPDDPCARADGTSTRTRSTPRPGWSTRQRLSPRITSWRRWALPPLRKRPALSFLREHPRLWHRRKHPRLWHRRHKRLPPQRHRHKHRVPRHRRNRLRPPHRR